MGYRRFRRPFAFAPTVRSVRPRPRPETVDPFSEE
jgi:hypothetical protein